MKPTHNMRVAHKKKNVGYEFWSLFVTKNGILRFSFFGLKKWSWIKIVNDTTQNMKVADKNPSNWIFDFFVSANFEKEALIFGTLNKIEEITNFMFWKLNIFVS